MNSASNTTLGDILNQFRDDARNNRDLGDRFERMMQQFFRVDPLYAGLFSEVWMWNEWPLKGQVGDVGIDLVAQHRATGEYFAIQCKFYLPDHNLSKGDIDSFFTALGKPQFSKGIIVSTTGHVLFLVPSLSLLSQTLREWTAQAELPLQSLV